eukprot:6213321-Pleurochrysis_carterae.AAC.2
MLRCAYRTVCSLSSRYRALRLRSLPLHESVSFAASGCCYAAVQRNHLRRRSERSAAASRFNHTSIFYHPGIYY